MAALDTGGASGALVRMNLVGPVLRNITSNWATLGVNLVVSFFLAPFVVNALGSTYYGIWAVIMQFTGYLYLLDFGVRDSVIRYTAKFSANTRGRSLNRVLTTAFLLYTPITLLAVLASLGAAAAFPLLFSVSGDHIGEARIVTLLVGLTIAQTFLFNVFTGVLQGLQRFDLANIISVATALIRAALIVFALSIGYRIIALSAIQLGITLLQGVLWLILARHLLRRRGMQMQFVRLTRRRFSSIAQRLFGFSLYVFINNIGQKIIVASDAIIIGLFMPVAAVTYYAIAGNLIEYLRQLVVVTAQVFNPLTSHHAALRQTRQVQAGLVAGSKLVLTIAAPVVGAYVFMGREFIGLWMGREYMQPAADVLVVLALAQLVSAPHHTMSSVLYGLSRHRVVALLRVIEAIANVVLSIALIRQFGVVGVAFGTAIPHIVVVLFVLPVITARIVDIDLKQYFLNAYLRPMAAAVPYCIGAWWINTNVPASSLAVFFAQVAGLCVIYAFAIYLVVLDGTERSWINERIVRLSGRLGRRLAR